MSFKHLFSRSLSAAPDRLHFAAHSHHLWPDAAFAGHEEAANDAAVLADHKWDKVLGAVLPAVQEHIAQELNLPDPQSIAFASNTHEFIMRMASCFPPDRPLRILTTDGEFHSLNRQLKRWEEAGQAQAVRVPVAPLETFEKRFLETVKRTPSDWIFLSHVFFGSGRVVTGLEAIAHTLNGRSDWLIVDGYHSFMALDVDFSRLADRAFFLSGGYKYAMAGEGVCFVHAPPGYGPRPVNTGWYAAFGALSAEQDGGVPYAETGARFTGATFDPSGLYRFKAVCDMLASEGLTTAIITAHTRALQDHFLRTAAQAMKDADLLNDAGSHQRARFLAFRHPQAAQWSQALRDAGVVTDVRGEIIRFGFGLYQDMADVDALSRVCSQMMDG